MSLDGFEGLVVDRVEKGDALQQILVNCSYQECAIDEVTDLPGSMLDWFRDWGISGQGFMNQRDLSDWTLLVGSGFECVIALLGRTVCDQPFLFGI